MYRHYTVHLYCTLYHKDQLEGRIGRGLQRKIKWWFTMKVLKWTEIFEFQLAELNHYIGRMGQNLLNKLQFACLLKQVTFFYSNCHWKILINIDFFLYIESMFTWLFKGSVHINNSSYTIYKSLHFNPLIHLYLSPVIKQLALNKKCTVVLV